MTLAEIYQALTGGFAELKASNEQLLKSFEAQSAEGEKLKAELKASNDALTELQAEHQTAIEEKTALEGQKATLETENAELKAKVEGIPTRQANAAAQALADQGLTAKETEGASENADNVLTLESYNKLTTQERVRLLQTNRAAVLALRK